MDENSNKSPHVLDKWLNYFYVGLGFAMTLGLLLTILQGAHRLIPLTLMVFVGTLFLLADSYLKAGDRWKDPILLVTGACFALSFAYQFTLCFLVG